MTATLGTITQGSPNTDGQIFVGASEFKDTAGVSTYASAGAGLFTLNVPATDAATFFANVTTILRRTGQLATPSSSQEQFGTAASQPGPSSVSGTSGPLALPAGFPPYLAAALPTLATPVTGAPAKGFEITSMDVIYEVDTLALAAATCGLTVTQFVNGVAPAVTNRITLAANGLPTTVNTVAGQAYVKNVAVPSPVFSTAADGETIVNVNLTAGATGTAKFYGVVLHVNFNLN